MQLEQNDPIRRILLVDDEDNLLEALGKALESIGERAFLANSPSQALTILEVNPEIDVVVSDIRMPGMNGITLLKNIRTIFENRKWLQVIFITGHATLENSVDALRMEAVDFLHKPVRRAVFLEAVQRAQSKAQEKRQSEDLRNRGIQQLEALINEVRGLQSSFQQQSKSGPSVENATSVPLTKDRILELIKVYGIKSKIFKESIFTDPVWNMLMELFKAHLIGERISVSTLHMISGTSSATASRRILDMEYAGLIERIPDENDRRRTYARLTDNSVDLLQQYFGAINSL